MALLVTLLGAVVSDRFIGVRNDEPHHRNMKM